MKSRAGYVMSVLVQYVEYVLICVRCTVYQNLISCPVNSVFDHL